LALVPVLRKIFQRVAIANDNRPVRVIVLVFVCQVIETSIAYLLWRLAGWHSVAQPKIHPMTS